MYKLEVFSCYELYIHIVGHLVLCVNRRIPKVVFIQSWINNSLQMISMKGLSIWIGNGAGQLFPLELDSLAYMIFHGARKLDMKLLNIALYAIGLVPYKIKIIGI